MRRLSAIVAAAAMLLVLGSCSLLPGGNDDLEVSAYFPETAGLFVGNDVGVLGVPVGKITDITPDGDRVKVTFTVDGDVDVPANVGAVVTARSVATDRYIELTPVYHSGPKLEDGAEITRTDTPVDFDEVLSTLSDFADDISGHKSTANAIRRFLRVGANAFDGNGKLINKSITNLGAAVNTVSGQRDNILDTLRALDVLSAAFATNQSTIHRFTRSVATTVDLLADERHNLQATLTDLGTSLAVMSAFVKTHRSAIISSVNKLTDVLDNLLASKTDLQETVEVLPLALDNIARSVDRGLAVAKLSPTYISPLLGTELQLLCSRLPANLCGTLSFTPGTPIADLLGGLL